MNANIVRQVSWLCRFDSFFELERIKFLHAHANPMDQSTTFAEEMLSVSIAAPKLLLMIENVHCTRRSVSGWGEVWIVPKNRSCAKRWRIALCLGILNVHEPPEVAPVDIGISAWENCDSWRNRPDKLTSSCCRCRREFAKQSCLYFSICRTWSLISLSYTETSCRLASFTVCLLMPPGWCNFVCPFLNVSGASARIRVNIKFTKSSRTLNWKVVTYTEC